MITEPESGSRQRRRRFVIDFNPPAETKTRAGSGGRRWTRLLAVFGVVITAIVVLAAGGLFFWWRHYTSTPAYSLALLLDAVQRNDMTMVDQLIDTDKIVSNLAPQITEKTAARYGATLSAGARARLQALLPGLLPRVRNDAREALTKRVQQISESSEPKPFVALAIGLPYLVNINADDESARVTAPVGDKLIEITMQRVGERWKVTALKDDALVQRIVDDIIKEFPAVGQIR
ncbi:MAG: hypothetical protein ACRD8U_16205 [Pyrinomonadaceae bacterium]